MVCPEVSVGITLSGLSNEGSAARHLRSAIVRPLAPLEQGERPMAGSDEGSYTPNTF